MLKKGWLSDVDLWEGLVAFVQLGLIGGFWFQVGSHPCRQGDSGARGKTSSPLLTHVWSSTHQIWDLCVVSLCYWLKKKKTGGLTSAESVFVRDRNLNVCRNPRFFVVFWLQYSGSAALLCSDRIQSCSGAWHDTNGQKTQNNKKNNNIVWSCLIVLERSILMSVWGVESGFQFVCLFVTLSVCRFCRPVLTRPSDIYPECSFASQSKAWEFAHSSAWTLIAVIKKRKMRRRTIIVGN